MMTEAEFWAAVESEGDIASAIEYGLKPDYCEPGRLRDAWQALWDVMHSDVFVAALTSVENELGRVEEGMGW